jgi:hypothetical protein
MKWPTAHNCHIRNTVTSYGNCLNVDFLFPVPEHLYQGTDNDLPLVNTKKARGIA